MNHHRLEPLFGSGLSRLGIYSQDEGKFRPGDPINLVFDKIMNEEIHINSPLS
jgi:hypothetical protein